MSTTKKQITEQQRLKKMSKEQMQLAIIKKKQCDAKALAIVMQLLEPHVNPDWLLQNLGFMSKNHMEDVIEERVIVKLCGYVLCSNQLTVVIRQQYHISTRKNKVYDVSKRRNFCSSLCYGATNFLLEQMLESPLWLREKEDIPVFQILPLNSKPTCGEEIDVAGINFPENKNVDNNDDSKKSTKHTDGPIGQTEKDTSNVSSLEKETICNSYLLKNVATEEDDELKETSVNTNNVQRSFNYKMHSSELHVNQESEIDSEEFTNYESNYNIQQVDVNLENLEIEIAGQSGNILHLHKHNIENKTNVDIFDNKTLHPQIDEVSNNENDTSERLQLEMPQSVEISNNENDEHDKRLELQIDEVNNSLTDKKMIQSDKIHKSNNTVISSASMCNEYRKIGETSRINKNQRYRPKKTDNAGVQNNIYLKVAEHVEQSVKEWVTKNTLCLLIGDADERNQLLEQFTKYDRYQQLCKKLNKLQMEDEKEDHDLKKNELKPLPHFSVLQEDGKKMELKVRAFYEGQMTITSPEDSNKQSENKDNVESILPLTDAHTPNALRRRIFLDNLNKILPDLMRALTTNVNISSLAQCTYNNEKYSLIKILISTFNLSATNIVFKTAEWTLVGLIIIKMLSLIDTQLQLLLQSKQASMYTSMILTTYKLDSNYLDRFLMEITNNVEASKSNDKQC
ncbi:PREDICTED: RNA polymerase II subunit B1 CTD phosphatase Rpap2-like [Cyphomyrmex costatus]|uniref:RNA polymerase II subunit B1 CTD phosphatase RPAP2 homolog n=1 Tax=Cyphomyrmex costatus TaxID=456900 RepID=A0A151IP99_9HYME|nr:PREDICTED: RNA polymerase II subunit B1 CTD phosphatase Rpap2-like [Cyphomyrmex costatus]KYN07666.1 Putative RNA polymerase II subunit B1 CTD phosphatase RPAP2 [Cyphomyrmex costatus]